MTLVTRSPFAGRLLSFSLLAFAVAPAFSQPGAPSGTTTWRDPREGAFSIQLLPGWRASGGTVRKTRIEPHYLVRAQSPDGAVQLFMDDPDLEIHEVPNRRLQMLGIREGSRIPAGWGGVIQVDRFRQGAEAAAMYAKKVCPQASGMAGGRVIDQTQSANSNLAPIAAAEGKRLYADAGEMEFRCGANIGYVQALTLEVSDGQGLTLWLVYRLAGYIARPEAASIANRAVHLALASFQMDPSWLAAFARESGDTANNVIRESNAITASVMQRARAEQAAAEAASTARRAAAERASSARQKKGDGNGSDYNMQLGTKRVCDDLDRCQTVDANVTNWWSDCSGTFHAGAESGAAPPSSASACWHHGR